MIVSRFTAHQRPALMVERAHLRVLLGVLTMFAAAPASGVDDFASPYGFNDGRAAQWDERREQDSVDRWGRNRQPWQQGLQAEPSGRPAARWRGYDEAPYGVSSANDGSVYVPPHNRGPSTADRTRPPAGWAGGRRPYGESYADRMGGNRLVGQPALRDPYGGYGNERSTRRADAWAGDWQDGADRQMQQRYGPESDWQHEYPAQPAMRDRSGEPDYSVPRALHGEGSRDPWEASYTPDWDVGDSSSYYDPEPFEPWRRTEADRNGWDREAEERPWGRRRPSASEDARSTRDDRRRFEQDGSREAASPYARGVGPYGGSWYYPGPQSIYPPSYGLPGPGAMSGLAAWERFIWAGGWPGMMWW